MGKKRHWTEYDYENIYNKQILGEQTIQETIDRLGRDWNRCKIMVKTIQSGNMLESEIYPVWECKSARQAKKKKSREEQKRLNDINTCKEIVRYINNNFTTNDLLLTLDYTDYYYPTEERAKKDIKNYIKKLVRYRKKHNLPPLKYVYFISYMTEEEAKTTKTIRMHHHIIINNMNRDDAEKMWAKGGRVNSKRLQPDNYDLAAVGIYLANNRGGKRRWAKSRNLKPPIENRSVSRLTKKKTVEIAKKEPEHKELFEKLYSNKYRFLDSTVYYNDVIGGFYIRARMRKKIPQEKEDSNAGKPHALCKKAKQKKEK